MSIIADRRLYLTSDKGRVVEEGDPASAFLLCAAGRKIPDAVVEHHGLRSEDGRVVYGERGPEPEPEEWTLQMSPEEYLERYGPDAKNSGLAQRIVEGG